MNVMNDGSGGMKVMSRRRSSEGRVVVEAEDNRDDDGGRMAGEVKAGESIMNKMNVKISGERRSWLLESGRQ